MKLLQNSWSDMLVLDHIHQRLHNALPDDTTLHNGQKFDLLGLGLLGVPSLAEHFNELQNKLQELKFDVGDYICMKFLLLLNPGKGGELEGRALIWRILCWKKNYFFSRCSGDHQPKDGHRRLWKRASGAAGLHPHLLSVGARKYQCVLLRSNIF